MLRVDKLWFNIGGKEILRDISFEIDANEMLMVIGPNGAGKTSLIRAVMQHDKHKGMVLYEGMNMAELSAREIAKEIGVLTQNHSQQFDYTVEDIVKLGRFAYSGGIFSQEDTDGQTYIDEALCLTGMEQFRDRSVLTLSGGEFQRVFLAAVFAQNPRLLILDEPTNHLDLKYQIEVFETLKKWVRGEGRSVIAVVHDLNLVFTYGTKALLLNKGRVHASGGVETVLSQKNLKEVYEVDVCLWMQKLLKRWGGD
jgi:iron complex transport system ATP-binding protein